jgi:hypothetical protein
MQIHEICGEAALRLLVMDPDVTDGVGYDLHNHANIFMLDAESPVGFFQVPESSKVTMKMFDIDRYNPVEAMDRFFSTIFGLAIGNTKFTVRDAPHHHRRLVCNSKFKEKHLKNMCDCTTIVTLDYLGDNDLIGCMDQEYTGVFATQKNTFGAFVLFSSFSPYVIK